MASKRRRAKRNATLSAKVIKDVKRAKNQFERDASYMLSNALGFEVTVKIKRQSIEAPRVVGQSATLRAMFGKKGAAATMFVPLDDTATLKDI